jgi:hypothetical protein
VATIVVESIHFYLAGTQAIQPLPRVPAGASALPRAGYSRRLCRQTYSAWLQKALGKCSKIEKNQCQPFIFNMADSCIAFAGTAGADKQARGKAEAPAATRGKGWIAWVPAGLNVSSIIHSIP